MVLFRPVKRQKQKLKPKNSQALRESARDRSLAALAAMRHGATLSRAARENGVTPRTLRKYVGSALIQDRPGGRVRATKSDRLVRHLQIPGRDGIPVNITVRGSKVASKVARYKADINRLLRGDAHAMKKWHRKKIAGVALLTDEKTLIDQAEKDQLPYNLYRSLVGGGA